MAEAQRAPLSGALSRSYQVTTGSGSARRARPRAFALATLLALGAATIAAPALAQAPPPAPIVPPFSKAPAKPAKPPGKPTDLEIDPDAKPKEAPPLPPPDPAGWGTGGKDEADGKFAPGGAKKEEKKDEDLDKTPISLGRPGEAGLDTVIGFGDIRDITNDVQGKTAATVMSFVFFFKYRIQDVWLLTARFPLSRATLTGPQSGATDDFNTIAVGNLELKLTPAFSVTKRLRIVPEVGFYLPTAAGDPFASANDRGSLAQAIVNSAASGSRGWEDTPLFASKRLGIRFGAGIRYDTEALHFEAGGKLDIMGKVAGNNAKVTVDGIKAEIHTPNTTVLVGAGFSYDFFGGKLSPGLRTWLAAASLPVSEGTRDYSGPQFVLEPQVTTRWALNEAKTLGVKGGIGFILPVAGHLGGADDAAIRGFRIDASFFF